MEPFTAGSLRTIESSGEGRLQRCSRLKAEFLLGLLHIETATRLAVWFRRIPPNVARESSQFRYQVHQIADGNLSAASEIDGIGFVIVLGRAQDTLGGILDVKEFTRRAAGAPAFDKCVTALAGVDALLDERGNNVRGFWIEIVARPIEVDRQEVHSIQAVLPPVGLALNEDRFLGNAVGGIGLFRIAVPEIFFQKRDGGKLGVRANGAGDHDFCQVELTGLFNQFNAHDGIFVKELSRDARGLRQCRRPQPPDAAPLSAAFL